MKQLLWIVAAALGVMWLFSQNTFMGLLGFAFVLWLAFFISYPSVLTLIAMNVYPKDIDKGLEWFEKAFKTGRMKTDTILTYAYYSLRAGRKEKCEKLLNRVLSFRQDKSIYYKAKCHQGLLLWTKGQLDEAIEVYSEIFKEYKNTQVYGNLGHLLALSHDKQRALTFNLEAHEYNSEDMVIMDNLGVSYYHVGDFQKSIEIYKELMKKEPQFPVPYYNYAISLIATVTKAMDIQNLPKKQAYELLEEASNNLDMAEEILSDALGFKFTELAAVTEQQVQEKLDELGPMREKVDKLLDELHNGLNG